MNKKKSKVKVQVVCLGLCISISVTGNDKNTYQSPVLKEEKDWNYKLKQSKQGKQELEGFLFFTCNKIGSFFLLLSNMVQLCFEIRNLYLQTSMYQDILQNTS